MHICTVGNNCWNTRSWLRFVPLSIRQIKVAMAPFDCTQYDGLFNVHHFSALSIALAKRNSHYRRKVLLRMHSPLCSFRIQLVLQVLILNMWRFPGILIDWLRVTVGKIAHFPRPLGNTVMFFKMKISAKTSLWLIFCQRFFYPELHTQKQFRWIHNTR